MTTDFIWFLIFIFICHLNGQRVNIWSEPLLIGANLSDFSWNTGSLVSNNTECPSGSSCYELKKDRQLGIWLSTIGYHSIQLIYSIRTYRTGDSDQDYCQLWYTAGKYSNNWNDWTLIHSTSATMAPVITTIDLPDADNNEYFAFDFHAWEINFGDRCWINYLNLTGIPIPTTIEPTMEPTVNPTMQSTDMGLTNTKQTGLDQNNASNTSSMMTTSTTYLFIYVPEALPLSQTTDLAADPTTATQTDDDSSDNLQQGSSNIALHIGIINLCVPIGIICIACLCLYYRRRITKIKEVKVSNNEEKTFGKNNMTITDKWTNGQI